MARDVIDLTGNLVKADAFEPAPTQVFDGDGTDIEVGAAATDDATPVVAADATVAEAFQAIIDWANGKFEEAEG